LGNAYEDVRVKWWLYRVLYSWRCRVFHAWTFPERYTL